jgi:hypothetical protein
MGNVGSLFTMTLTALLVPLIMGKIPYFKRPSVIARRVVKKQLPGWVSFAELFFFVVSMAVLFPLLFLIENHAHQFFHHGRNIIVSIQPSFSADMIFFLIQALAPLIMALPLCMLLANLISWLIPPIRKIEYKVMAEGVPGYNWHDLNFGLIKASVIISPVCIILDVISLVRL